MSLQPTAGSLRSSASVVSGRSFAAAPKTRVVWRRVIRLGSHVVVLAVIGLLWQWAAAAVDDATILCAPIAVAVQLWTWIFDGTLVVNVGYTFTALTLGFLLGLIFAEGAAVALEEFRSIGDFAEPYILALSAVPNIALAPMFIAWFGLGLSTKLIICGMTTFFTVFVSLYAGLRATEPHLLEMARILDATRWQRLLKIKIFASIPFLVAGVKSALPRALIAVVVAEFISSNKGIGYLILRNAQLMNTAGVFAGALVLTLIAYGLMFVTSRAERRLEIWKPAERR
jgi:NitT/TauT family transport system permease protein